MTNIFFRCTLWQFQGQMAWPKLIIFTSFFIVNVLIHFKYSKMLFLYYLQWIYFLQYYISDQSIFLHVLFSYTFCLSTLHILVLIYEGRFTYFELLQNFLFVLIYIRHTIVLLDVSDSALWHHRTRQNGTVTGCHLTAFVLPSIHIFHIEAV